MNKYAAISAPIGLMQVVDAWYLARNTGAVTPLVTILATIEFIWAITSLAVILRVKHRPTRNLAAGFFLYNLAGWIVSFFLLNTPLPQWTVYAGGVFGFSFAIASVYIASRL